MADTKAEPKPKAEPKVEAKGPLSKTAVTSAEKGTAAAIGEGASGSVAEAVAKINAEGADKATADKGIAALKEEAKRAGGVAGNFLKSSKPVKLAMEYPKSAIGASLAAGTLLGATLLGGGSRDAGRA